MVFNFCLWSISTSGRLQVSTTMTPYELQLQYCAKVTQTKFDEFPGFSWLFEEISRDVNCSQPWQRLVYQCFVDNALIHSFIDLVAFWSLLCQKYQTILELESSSCVTRASIQLAKDYKWAFQASLVSPNLRLTGSVANLPRSGRPKKLSMEARAFIDQQMRRNDETTRRRARRFERSMRNVEFLLVCPRCENLLLQQHNRLMFYLFWRKTKLEVFILGKLSEYFLSFVFVT